MRFLPIIMNSKFFSRKTTWLTILVMLMGGYQFISDDGFTSKVGLSSFDSFYKEPRDILIDRVEDARDVQQEAAEEFKSALEKFKEVTSFSGGDLEDKYNTLNNAFQRSEKSANNISKRVDRVVSATNNLLAEWRDELDDYHDAGIKNRAQQQFDQTRLQAEKLIAAMRKVEDKTKPVLDAFRDQVLFLKHNLNMQAISSLQQTSTEIEHDVSSLILEMEQSISEAELFISSISS